jgi:hypothetical protein
MEGNLHSAVPTASRTGETTRPRAHTGPPLVPHRHLHHPPLSRASALHRGGVPDADCGPRNFIIGPTPVARPSPPPLGISASARRLPPPPLLRPAAVPPQGSNPRTSPSPPPFFPRYRFAPRVPLFIPPARRQRRSLCRGRVELVRSARRTPICATSGETARRHCSHGSCRGAGVRCSLALPGYTHTGFKLGMDWAAPPEVLHAPDRSGIPRTLYGNWQWQGYWGG